MVTARRSGFPVQISISFGALVVVLSVLWIAGGASKADVLGQVVVRSVAWLALVIAVLAEGRLAIDRIRLPLIFFAAVLALPLLQLVPLPVAVWQALPGRSALAGAAVISGEAQPWRPWSMVPAATINAAGSLIVPGVVLVLITGLRERERSWLPGILLGLIAADAIVGLLQFSGAGFDNTLVNDSPGQVSGMFANRNHFALFLAIGCLIAPVWAFLGGRRPHWRGPAALGLVLLFVLTILATGSRAGMIVGVVAVTLGLLLAWHGLRREFRGSRRWMFPAIIGGVVALLVIVVFISVSANRAESINRLIAIDAGGDTRVRALPTVLAMIQTYFPAGIGFGSFDPVFRMNEPYALLKPTYFNHAHNDFLEVVLEGGGAAALVMLVIAGWAFFRGVRAWSSGPGRGEAMAQAGSAILVLVGIASIFDYPARTPMVMALVVIAGSWLAEEGKARGVAALPTSVLPL